MKILFFILILVTHTFIDDLFPVNKTEQAFSSSASVGQRNDNANPSYGLWDVPDENYFIINETSFFSINIFTYALKIKLYRKAISDTINFKDKSYFIFNFLASLNDYHFQKYFVKLRILLI